MKQVQRNKTERRKVSEGTWFISYGDMITLLLGFFVLFFSIEPPKKGDTQLADSLLATLEKLDKEMPTRIKLEDPGSQGETKNSVETQGKDVSALAEQASQRPENDASDKSIGEHLMEIMKSVLPIDNAGEGQFAAKKPVEQKRLDSKKARQLSGVSKVEKGTPTGTQPRPPTDSGFRKNIIKLEALQAEAIRQDDRIFIMFPTVSFFSSASTNLTKEGLDTIKKFGNVYLPFAGKTKLNIVGFADQRPVRSEKYTFKDNLELSVLRAVSAQRVLGKIGIPTQKVRLMGHGINTKLIKGEDPKSKREAYALARKIMFIIEPEKSL